MNAEGVACKLSAPGLAERTARWRRLSARAASSRNEDGLIVTSWPRDEQLIAELQILIAAEAACCSFLQFTVEEGPQQSVLTVRGLDDVDEKLAQQLGLAAPG